MKRYMNYVLILANVLSFVGIVITLGLLLHWNKQVPGDGVVINNPLSLKDVYDNLKKIVAIPVLSMILSCGILSFYQYRVYIQIKKTQDEKTIKNLRIIKIVSLLSVVNYAITCVLGIVGCLLNNKGKITDNIVVLSVGVGLCAIFSLLVIGYISYLNLRIAFDDARANGTLDQIAKSTEVSDKQANNSNKDDTKATSGSF